VDSGPEVPTLLCIGRRGRVTMRTIGLTNWFPSLLHDMCNRMILANVQIRPSWFALISMLLDRGGPQLTNWFPSLLHDMCNRMILANVQIRPSWFALISMLLDRVGPCGPPP
jgi:hypothetical protein